MVILGLIGLTHLPLRSRPDWMHKADSIAALVVAVIVIYVSAELGLRTISGLLDTAPKGWPRRSRRSPTAVPAWWTPMPSASARPGRTLSSTCMSPWTASCHFKEAHAATEMIEDAILKDHPIRRT